MSAKNLGDPASQVYVADAVEVAPGGVDDLFGLESADFGFGAEQKPEVDVLVVRLGLGGVGIDRMDVDVEGESPTGLTESARMPVSSVSSRLAASPRLVSVDSRWPPGRSHLPVARWWMCRMRPSGPTRIAPAVA